MSKKSVTRIKSVRILERIYFDEVDGSKPYTVFYVQKLRKNIFGFYCWVNMEEPSWHETTDRTFIREYKAKEFLSKFIDSAREVYGHIITFDKKIKQLD